jgi:histidinol phosphatase-like PHP family hydrolase
MNNLDIVLALFTTLNHRFSRLDTTAAFQAAISSHKSQETALITRRKVFTRMRMHQIMKIWRGI